MAHAGTSGLQSHSVGPEYPFAIVGKMAHAKAPTQWAVMNCLTGAEGRAWPTYRAAQIDLASLRVRDLMHS